MLKLRTYNYVFQVLKEPLCQVRLTHRAKQTAPTEERKLFRDLNNQKKNNNNNPIGQTYR